MRNNWTRETFHRAVVPLGLILAAAAALTVDCPLAQWCLAGKCPAPLEELFRIVESFGHGLGVVVILVALHQLDPNRRWALPRVLACSLGAGLAADVVKLMVVRIRPQHASWGDGVWATFGNWLPGISAGSSGQSFPSAHTATAVGLAAALIWLYPNGRRLFLVLAVLVACQRIEGGKHYLSDTLCGAAVGCFVAGVLLKTGWLSAHFDRWEHGQKSSAIRLFTPAETPASSDQSRRRAA